MFILLADKARAIQTERVLVGWLYRAACYQAARSRRSEYRRRKRENEAASMNVDNATQTSVNGGAKAEKNRRFEILVAPVRKSVSFDDVTS